MKKLVAIVSSLIFSVSTVFAGPAPKFFERAHGQWSVLGHPPYDGVGSVCVMKTVWRNGAQMNLVFDLEDGEMFLSYHNPDWNILDPEGKEGEVIIRFEDSTRWVNVPYKFVVRSPRTIMVRHLPYEPFIDMFAAANKLSLYMPGSIPNVVAGMSGTRAAMGSMGACLKYARENGLSKIQPPSMSMDKPESKPGIRM
jgi:hypothetical protein